MDVAEIGSFHIGGRNVALAGLAPRRMRLTPSAPERDYPSDGDFETGQMYVRFVRLARPVARYPLLMWHGGGMTGVTWETKPDGGAGWEAYFLNAGHDVFVSDAMERGRSGWSRYPEIYPEPPHFRSKKESWELFRFGPEGSYPERRAFAGQQFPVNCFEQFSKQIVPRWGCHDEPTQAAYDALVRRVGPCVIVTHSQGGHFGFAAALHAPDLVRAVISIEPSGAPSGVDVSALRPVPHLTVMGDYLADSPFWRGLLPAVARHRDALIAAGGVADWLDLPALGIVGNSHFPMMDRNSDAVAALIEAWMRRQGLCHFGS